MAAFALSAVNCRALRILFGCALGAVAITGCDREGGEHPRQIDGLKADLDESKRRLSHIQNSLAAKDAELAVNTQALEAARASIADLQKTLEERNDQLRTAKVEIDELKKRDAIVFGDIVALQQQGQGSAAVARYQKFITDFPKSPLVANAKAAIAQLTELPPEIRKQLMPPDPGKKEREFTKTFNEGYMTLQELVPYLKGKSLPQVLNLLGKPNQSFAAGTEIGYAERAINPATGMRGMLVIGFDAGIVNSLRVEYAGRKMMIP